MNLRGKASQELGARTPRRAQGEPVRAPGTCKKLPIVYLACLISRNENPGGSLRRIPGKPRSRKGDGPDQEVSLPVGDGMERSH
jgi:hypothetical protein